jgi:carboxyl-terminal processing protease
MKKELQKDGLAEGAKDELDALSKAIDLDKVAFLRAQEKEIIPFIEEEIVVRYYYQMAGVKVRLRYDDELHEALTKPLIKI